MTAPNTPDAATISTSLRLPRDLADRLDAIAEERLVGRNLLIVRAIEEFLDVLPDVAESTTPPRLHDVTLDVL